MSQSSPVESLAQTVAALVSAGNDTVAFQIALDATLEAAGADMGAVFRPAGRSLRMALSRNLPHELRRRPPLLDTEQWSARIFVKTHGREPPGAPLQEARALQGIPTWATAPARAGGQVHGLLLIASRDLVGFTAQALAHLEIISTVLGLTLAVPAPTGEGPPPAPTQVGPAPGPAPDPRR